MLRLIESVAFSRHYLKLLYVVSDTFIFFTNTYLKTQIDGWGRDRFMRSETLADADYGYLHNNLVRFKVEITVHGELVQNGTNGGGSTADVTSGSASASASGLSDNGHSSTSATAAALPPPSTATTTTAAAASSFPVLPEESTIIDPEHAKMMHLNTSLLALLKDARTADLSILAGVEQTCLPAHKFVLMSRSPVFSVMFTNSMAETVSNELRIPDFDATIVGNMLQFAYSDRCDLVHPDKNDESPRRSKQVHSLMALAVMYDIPGLIAACEGYFEIRVTCASAIPLLQFAEDHRSARLKHAALRFIATHPGKFQRSQEFQDLGGPLMLEVDRAMQVVAKRRTCVSILMQRDKRYSQGQCSIM